MLYGINDSTMARLLLLVITIQVVVNAAPSDVTKLEDIARDIDTPDTESQPRLEESNVEDTAEIQGQRQKRWYDFGAFGFPPPINPVPSFVKRDQSQSTGVYGLVEDPLSQVYRRIQDIASFGRQPNYPILPPQIPIYLPVLFIPQACNCNPQTPPQTNNENGTMPGINNRFPAMDDTRQNWGYVIDPNDFVDNGEDPSRPINFDFVPPNRTLTRPPPPVEHGTVQGDGNSNSVNSVGGPEVTTRRPPPPPPPPAAQDVPKMTTDELPTNCDAAVLSCCHQPEITLDCFDNQGCPSVNSYGNPCEASVILRVIERFQKFYLQRTG